MSDHADRVSKVFDKLNHISNNIENEKQTRFQQVANLITQFENGIDEINQRKEARFNLLADKLKQLQDYMENEQSHSEKIDFGLQKDLSALEKNCQKILDANSKDRLSNEKQIAHKVQVQIDQLQSEVSREAQVQQNAHAYLDTYLSEDLFRLREGVNNEMIQRKEVDEKIYTQFMQQLNEQKEIFEREKKEREHKEEEIIQIMREVSSRIQEQLAKSKRERERSEEMMVMLVEQVVEKIKKEMVELE